MDPLVVGRRDVLVSTLWALLLALFPWMRTERGAALALDGAEAIARNFAVGETKVTLRPRRSGVVMVTASLSVDGVPGDELRVRIVRRPDGTVLQDMTLLPEQERNMYCADLVDQIPDGRERTYRIEVRNCSVVEGHMSAFEIA